MTIGEAQANPDIVIGIMVVFGSPARVLFYSKSTRSFVRTFFALHSDRELSPLKHKLVVTTLWESRFSVIRFSRDVRF